MSKIESTLVSLTPHIWSITDLEQARTLLLSHLEESKIKDRDKMIKDVKELKNLNSLHRYTANALLKFEGLGVGDI